MRPLALLALALPLAVATVGCVDDSSPSASGPVEGLAGGVAMRLSPAQIEALSAQVDSLEIRLSNGSEARVVRVGLSSLASVQDLAPGSWSVEVLLTRDGVARYQGTTTVTVVPGLTVQARVVLRPASGGIDLEIVIDDGEDVHPAQLQGTWYLRSLAARGLRDLASRDIPLTLDSVGQGDYYDGCNGVGLSWGLDSVGYLRITSGPQTLKYCELDSIGTAIDQELHGRIAGGQRLKWLVDTGWSAAYRTLTLIDPLTRDTLAVFTPYRDGVVICPPPIDTFVVVPTDPVPGMPLATHPDLAGTHWSLSALPAAAVDSVAGAWLSFEADGLLGGNDGCNLRPGTWKTADTLMVLHAGATKMYCLDERVQATERGMAALFDGRVLSWTVISGCWGRNLMVRDAATGAVLADFHEALPAIDPRD